MDILLGLIGDKNSGKSIVVEHLVENYGFTVLSKTDIIKYKILESADLPREDIFPVSTQEVNNVVRVINKYYQNNEPEYFARLIKNSIKAINKKPIRCILPDLSFKEEFDLLFKNPNTFIFNKDITENGVIIGDLFQYRLTLELSGSFDDDFRYSLSDVDKSLLKKTDLFISGTNIAIEYIKSLDIVMKGLLPVPL